jgi:hypothetical protein
MAPSKQNIKSAIRHLDDTEKDTPLFRVIYLCCKKRKYIFTI